MLETSTTFTCDCCNRQTKDENAANKQNGRIYLTIMTGNDSVALAGFQLDICDECLNTEVKNERLHHLIRDAMIRTAKEVGVRAMREGKPFITPKLVEAVEDAKND